MSEPNVLLRNRMIDLLNAERNLRSRAPKPGVAYSGPLDFVLREGETFDVRSPARVPGPPGRCYGNSIFIACTLGLEYVEGYALPSKNGFPVAHAWNVDHAGRVIDSTWLDTSIDHGVAYLGVRFSPERADIATWDGDAHILTDPPNPLYEKRWRGEVEWDETPRTRVYRHGSWEDGAELLKVMHAEVYG